MLENANNVYNDKFLGAFLGAAIGDALGWPNEFRSNNSTKNSKITNESFQKWIRTSGGRFWSHEEVIYPGEYSDDTQLLISTARSLTYGEDWHKFFTRFELPAWLSYERGGGVATKRAASVWKIGKTPWKIHDNAINKVRDYFNAGGNSVAMRILPHVFYCYNDVNELIRQVVRNGIYTHGHPRALVGATVYAYALYLACKHTGTLGYGELVDNILLDKHIWGSFPDIHNINEWLESANVALNRSYLDLWDDTVNIVIDKLKVIKEGLSLGALDFGTEILEKVGCLDKKINGAGDVTAISAIYLASKYASNPKMGVLEAAYMYGADTDTLASMVGGLLGMIHGSEWIPLGWQGVQDKDYIAALASKLSIRYSNELKTYFNTSVNRAELKDIVKNAGIGTVIQVLPFGELKVVDIWNNKTKTENIIVSTIKLQSIDGQTIFIKKFEKKASKQVVIKNEANVKQSENNENKYEGGQRQRKVAERSLLMLNAENIELIIESIDDNFSAKKLMLLFKELLVSNEKDLANIGARFDIPEQKLKMIYDLFYGKK